MTRALPALIRAVRAALLLALLLALPPLRAAAQDGPQEAALVADSLAVTADGRLVATGNVQAFYQGSVLSAARVTYDREADRLLIEGPILLRSPDGTVVAAERAELDPRLEDGLLRGARLVLDRQLQIAANRLDRLGGLTALTGAAVTSCQVCPGRAPLWEIRAEQVIHDEEAQILHFENATFRVRGVPILWVPRLRLPDPGNARASGLLLPRLRTTDRLGVGLKLPVFLELGPSRDLTVTPYLSPETGTLELRYREAFLRGDLLVEGAVSRDSLRPGEARGFLRAEGAFDLGGGLRLAFSGVTVTDSAYLSEYGQGDDDRLQSTLRLSRVGADFLVLGDLSHVRSLRAGEPEESLPPLLGALSAERRAFLWGGTATLGAGLDGFRRMEEGAGASARDGLRLGAFAAWRGTRVLRWGLVAEGEARAALDGFRVTDDPRAPETLARAAPAAQVVLRWPLLRRRGGVADLVEPVVSLGWSGAWGEEPPNEDSRLVELDEGRLHALSRLPGEDATERGARLSYGVAWRRQAGGAEATLALGQVLRADPTGLPEASGLDGGASHVLLAGGLDWGGAVAFDARTLLEPGEGFGRTEARLDWQGEALSLSAAYVHLPADEGERRARTAAEWTVDGRWRASERWTLSAGGRYDVARDQPARASLGLGWRNECVEVDVTLTRRYTVAGDGEPSTDFGLSVDLLGFSADGPRVAPGACRG